MAIFRKLHVSFWKDEYIENLTPEQKFMFVYLLTNDRTTQCGIYELTLKQMSFDTGFDIQKLLSILELFEKEGKILYNPETKEIALKNWAKYNVSSSPTVMACIKKEIKSVKDRVLIQYVYSIDTIKNQFGMCIDTLLQEEEEQQEEKQQEQEKDKDQNFSEKIGVAPEMFKAFKNKFPNYPKDQKKDFTACLEIAYKIGEASGFTKNEVTGAKKGEVLKYWLQIIEWVAQDQKWFAKRALYDLNNEWQRLIQTINNGQPNTINGKGNTGVTSEQLNQAHAKYFG